MLIYDCSEIWNMFELLILNQTYYSWAEIGCCQVSKVT